MVAITRTRYSHGELEYVFVRLDVAKLVRIHFMVEIGL
jgi:hypothetical protein